MDADRPRRRDDGIAGRPSVAAILVIALLAAASGCRAQQPNPDSTAPPGTLSVEVDKDAVELDDLPNLGGRIAYGLISETNGWNPALNQWASSGLMVSHAIFDTLAAFDSGGAVHPFLATSFDHSEDYRDWWANIPTGVTFHNGEPLTAEAVQRNQRYLKKSPVTRDAYFVIDSITAEGERVHFHMRDPFVNFPAVLATQIGVVAEPDWLESNDGLQPIGTGPFSFGEWIQGKSLTVEKNQNYWRKDRFGNRMPYLDSVEFRVIADEPSRRSAMLAGDVDVVQTNNPKQMKQFLEDDSGQFQVLSDAAGETPEIFVQLNVAAPPLDDIDARRALAYATDRKSFREAFLEGLFDDAEGPFAPGSKWHAPTGYPSYDPVKATELVEKVKATHGGRFGLTLTGVASPGTTETLQFLQQQWQSVGIDTTIDLVEQAKMIIEVVSGGYQAVLWQQFDSPYPPLDAVWWSPDSWHPIPEFSLNFARNNDPRILVELEKTVRSEDESVRVDAMKRVASLLGEDIPYLWLYHSHQLVIARTQLVNVTRWELPGGADGLPFVQGSHPLAQVWIRP